MATMVEAYHAYLGDTRAGVRHSDTVTLIHGLEIEAGYGTWDTDVTALRFPFFLPLSLFCP